MSEFAMTSMTWTDFVDRAAYWGDGDLSRAETDGIVIMQNHDGVTYNRDEYFRPNGARMIHRAASRSNWIEPQRGIVDNIFLIEHARVNVEYALHWEGKTRDELRPSDPNTLYDAFWRREYHIPLLMIIDGENFPSQVNGPPYLAQTTGATLYGRYTVRMPWRPSHEPLGADFAAIETGTGRKAS